MSVLLHLRALFIFKILLIRILNFPAIRAIGLFFKYFSRFNFHFCFPLAE